MRKKNKEIKIFVSESTIKKLDDLRGDRECTKTAQIEELIHDEWDRRFKNGEK